MKSVVLSVVAVLVSLPAFANEETGIYIDTKIPNSQIMIMGSTLPRLTLESKKTKGKKFEIKSCSYTHTILVYKKQSGGRFISKSSYNQTMAFSADTQIADKGVKKIMSLLETGYGELTNRLDDSGRIDLIDIAENTSDEELKADANTLINAIRAICQ